MQQVATAIRRGGLHALPAARRSLAAVARDPATPKELAAAARKTAEDLER